MQDFIPSVMLLIDHGISSTKPEGGGLESLGKVLRVFLYLIFVFCVELNKVTLPGKVFHLGFTLLLQFMKYFYETNI